MVEITPQMRPAYATDAVPMHHGSVALHGLIEKQHSDIDGRTTWPRRFKTLFDKYVSDLGGIETVSTAKQSLIRRAVVTEIELERIEAKLAVQESPSDKMLDLYGRLGGHLRRTFEVLGIERIARDVTPSLDSILDSADHARKARKAHASNGAAP